MLKSPSLSMSINNKQPSEDNPTKELTSIYAKSVINSCMFILFASSVKFVPAVHATWATSRDSAETAEMSDTSSTVDEALAQTI